MGAKEGWQESGLRGLVNPLIVAVPLRVAEKVIGRETRSGFEVEPDLALVELQTRVEGPPGF